MESRMNSGGLNIVILGLSITSSWGNGHSTTYRGLLRALAARGHNLLFLERDVPWYAQNRDLPKPPYCRTYLYPDLNTLRRNFSQQVKSADLVIVGSYVPEGIEVGEWVLKTARGIKAFYDIDTPITLTRLKSGTNDYLSRDQIPRYDMYLSFTGGPVLKLIERAYGSPFARELYCSFDPEFYYPEAVEVKWDLGYMGTYSNDRQPVLEELMLNSARNSKNGRFAVVGPLYPDKIVWPVNVERIQHLPPSGHRSFFNAQRFTLNITRAAMIQAGYSPSVRLFEAAACGTPIISDYWEGLETLFRPGKEILIARSSKESTEFILDIPEKERRAIGDRGRKRVLSKHRAAHRVSELERYIGILRSSKKGETPELNAQGRAENNLAVSPAPMRLRG
jgi:spore maturation protein CgeB